MNVGIAGFGAYIPRRRLSPEEIGKVWKNPDVESLKDELIIRQRVVLDPDEDTNTLAIMAAKDALARAGISPQAIGAVYLGTRTNPYASRPSSTLLSEAIGIPGEIFTADIQLGNRSGIAVISISMAMVESGMAPFCLAVGSDTISRYASPGSIQEYYASSGAAGFVISGEGVIAEIEGLISQFDKSPDLSPSDLKNHHGYSRQSRHNGSLADVEDSIIPYLVSAVKNFFASTNEGPEDFRYAVFQQPYGRIPKLVSQQLGFDSDQINDGLIAPAIGDCGSASVLIGLVGILDVAQPGERILMASYGSGGYDILSLKATPYIEERRRADASIKNILADGISVDYATAMKYEHKYLKVPYALSAFS